VGGGGGGGVWGECGGAVGVLAGARGVLPDRGRVEPRRSCRGSSRGGGTYRGGGGGCGVDGQVEQNSYCIEYTLAYAVPRRLHEPLTPQPRPEKLDLLDN